MVKIEVIPNRGILKIGDYIEGSYTLSHGELFREFCEKKKVPIQLPYIGGQYWAKEISKLGHIAIMEDSFGICVYSFYQLDRYQRNKVITKKQEWKKANFSGVIVDGDGNTVNFDKELLNDSDDLVVQKFVEELVSPPIKQKRKEGVR